MYVHQRQVLIKFDKKSRGRSVDKCGEMDENLWVQALKRVSGRNVR